LRIAVTGITGSFGSAFARRVLTMDGFGIDRFVGISRDELKQSEMAEQYKDAHTFKLFLGDVRDEMRMREAFHGIDVVVHAAALKRVDACAYNPREMMKTNVDGTANVVSAAAHEGVARVLVISSDKACEPLNIYGASKLMAEQIAVSMNASVYPRGTRVSALRYGNVIGSRGSVAHIWRAQHALGQPLSITHRDMTRFVLTLDQAVGYAMKAIQQMEGGEIFVPILPSAKLPDFAAAIVGGTPKFNVVGLRDGGEKFAEALLTVEEPSRTVKRNGFYVVTPSPMSWRPGGWKGDKVDPKLRYISDGSHGWATPQELRRLVKEAGL
jgi:UDP-N-acetylglucosamine 4,6-dehydratase